MGAITTSAKPAGVMGEDGADRQLAEYRHHGDHGIPPRQGFGGFARTLLAGLGVPVENHFGLRSAACGFRGR